MTTDGKKIDLMVAVTPKSAQSASHQIIYANASRMAISPWDVRFVFGQVLERGGETINEDAVTIIVAPAQAKALLNALTTTVNMFEQTFGEIKDPTSVLLAAQQTNIAIAGSIESSKKAPPKKKEPIKKKLG